MLFLSLILYGASCSIIKPSFSCFTVNPQLQKLRSCSLCLFTVAFWHHIFYISHYKRKYLSRIIPYASNGSFNPYMITNKEAHMVNGNPPVPKDSNCHKCSKKHSNPNYRNVSLKKYQSHCFVQASHLCKCISGITA